MNTTYQIPATTHLGEVSLRIMNLDRSIKFYTDVVGLKLLERSGKIATLTADGKQSLLRLEELTDGITLPERSHTGLYHFAVLPSGGFRPARGQTHRPAAGHRGC